ncbi:hypothetical protein L0F63_000834 [Massospora cicadina]|nr:hypothetical protein L0F63_000834 [Massospora cicadina]
MNGAAHSGVKINFDQAQVQLQTSSVKPAHPMVNERPAATATTFILSSEPGVHPRSKRSFSTYTLKDNISLLKILVQENPYAARFGDKLSSWKRFSDALTGIGHLTNPKKCREHLTKLLDENENSEWFKKRCSGEKLELSEFESLVEKAILFRRAGATNSQKPEHSSPHNYAGNGHQIVSPQLPPNHSTQTVAFSAKKTSGEANLFSPRVINIPSVIPQPTAENASNKPERPFLDRASETSLSNSNKRSRLDSSCEKDKELERLNKALVELRNQVAELTQSKIK